MSHHHPLQARAGNRRLGFSILLNLSITVVEVVGGLFSGSLALLSDALHNFSDTSSLVITYVARRYANREATARKTFGYQRAEIIGAFINLVSLVLIALFLMKEAVERALAPQPINGPVMLTVAAFGLVANLLTAVLLRRDARHSLNIRAAFLHITTDAVSSVVVIAGGVFIYFFESYLIDPLLSFLISIYILFQSVHLLRDTINILMESTPASVDLAALREAVHAHPRILDMHHLHVWQLDEINTALEAHVVIAKQDLVQMETIKADLKRLLHDRFDIAHSTLEFELIPCDPALDPLCFDPAAPSHSGTG